MLLHLLPLLLPLLLLLLLLFLLFLRPLRLLVHRYRCSAPIYTHHLLLTHGL